MRRYLIFFLTCLLIKRKASSIAPIERRSRFYHLLILLQLLEPAQDWHTTSVGGKGFLTNEPGTQTMCSTYSYKEQDGEIDTTSGTASPVITDGQGHRMMQTRVFVQDTNWEGKKQVEEFYVLRFPSSL